MVGTAAARDTREEVKARAALRDWLVRESILMEVTRCKEVRKGMLLRRQEEKVTGA